MKLRVLLPLALLVGCSSSSSGGPQAGPPDATAPAPDAAGMPDAAPPVDAAPPPPDAVAMSVDANIPPPPADVAAACASFASAVCNRLQACTAFGLGATYGDLATCNARVAISCDQALTAPSTGATTQITTACAAALPQVSCTDFLSGNYGASCTQPAGTIAAAGACGDDAQCATAFCARPPTSQCGTCAAPTKAGDPCVNGGCTMGQSCQTGGTKCAGPGTGQPGDACMFQEDCDLAHAVGCNTVSGRCLSLTLAAAGGACGVDSVFNPTSFAVCPASGTCSAVTGGTCSPPAADGAPCTAGSASTNSTGPSCLPPAKCVNGNCLLPAPSACH